MSRHYDKKTYEWQKLFALYLIIQYVCSFFKLQITLKLVIYHKWAFCGIQMPHFKSIT